MPAAVSLIVDNNISINTVLRSIQR